MQNATEIVIAIISAATGIAGAIRWSASIMARAISAHAQALNKNTEAQNDNTQALQMNTASRDTARAVMRKSPAVLLLLALLLLAGCGTVDPLVIRAHDRNRQVWEEDRRPDLDPELVKSRVAEFEAQRRYLVSPK